MTEQGAGVPTEYWGRHLLKNILALEVYAEDYVAAGQSERAAQNRWYYRSTYRKSTRQSPEAPGPTRAEHAAALRADRRKSIATRFQSPALVVDILRLLTGVYRLPSGRRFTIAPICRKPQD